MVAATRSGDADPAGKAKALGTPRSASAIKNWTTFFNERAPLPVYVLLALGPCLSGFALADSSLPLPVTSGQFSYWQTLAIVVAGQLLYLITLRCMDDVKDYDKDVKVHPDRPLPRGLILYDELVNAIRLEIALLCVYAVVLWFVFSPLAGATFGLQIVYLVLMYIEFGIGHWLDPRVFLYALTHQASIYVGALHISAITNPDLIWDPRTYWLGTVALSGAFTYEVCRKLDPTLDPLKGTYRVVLGKWPTYAIVLFTVSLGVVSSHVMGLSYMLWPIQALLLVALTLHFVLPQRKSKHKLVEIISIFYVLLHIWSQYIHRKWY
ncbi:hypothetical protein CAOG_00588 [Capsaspora owczarzaki ATCC 30864]|uniref:UbiA prenyltransferase n=1 Tax=Capsaspora owczarzaki (strain ATCC 30864) TaxID=595528 RepID=A0A0D2X0G7_CAPO3|nr:hypothetical protein CAOG_00588 [Capsaspora owczarzaki ATCC 30864]KJE89029.1 hypothetical protein CAOG_000588 [Capsaspora owczarzaki ATCC 30864]|eukprot:XP_004365459.1 hypothetical protein CAOG_00588 [Capsaspora owczarzaki ATCC 30864]